KKLKNKINTINVDGHITRVVTYDAMELEGKIFPSIRVILLPPSFVIEEMQKMQKEKNLVSLATFYAWLFIFGPKIKPRKVNDLSSLLSKKDKFFKKNDGFYGMVCSAGLEKEKPLDRMIEFAEKIKRTSKANPEELSWANPEELSCEVKNDIGEDIGLPAERLNQTLRDFINCYILYIEALNGKNKKESLKEAQEYLETMKERFPDQEKRKHVLQHMGKRIESKWFYIYERIANNFAEKLKKYVSKNELKLFNLLHTRQNFLGNRIIRLDIERDLINPKDLKLIPLLILVGGHGVKTIAGYNSKSVIKFIVKDYLIVVRPKRFILPMEERDKKREQRRKEHEISFSDYLSPSSASNSFLNNISGPSDIEKEYQQKQVKEKIKNIIKEQCSERQIQVYEMLEKGLTPKEIAEELGYSQPSSISKILKKIREKLRKNGISKNSLVNFD
ncbi:MAG: hypothetical protein L6408_05905, partial [Nanoarchaeota archaeon]|nr:hypothetical protein [Nanoarchaeota archaeon]